jgi:hypothetical protein
LPTDTTGRRWWPVLAGSFSFSFSFSFLFSREINLNPPLTLGQLLDTSEELMKLDQVFIKSELKVGVIYVKEGQYTEEEILDNNDLR